MADRRRKNVEWNIADENGGIPTWDRVGIAVLMDIRDELQRLNSLLHCGNFIGIPHELRQLRPIARMARRANTTAAKRRKAAK